MPIVTQAVYENGVLRPLEALDLPEHTSFLVTIWSLLDDEAEAEPESLADVLGFDPTDQERLRLSAEQHRQALLEMALSSTARSEPPHNGSDDHDSYLYGDPHR